MRKYRNIKKTCSFLRSKGKGVKSKPVYIPKEKINEEDTIDSRSGKKTKSSSFYKNKYKKKDTKRGLKRLNYLLFELSMKSIKPAIGIESLVNCGGDILM